MSETNKIITEMQAIKDAIKTGFNTLSSNIGSTNERLDVLTQEVSFIKQDVSSLKLDVSTLKLDVSVLKQDVSSLKLDVSSLKLELTTFKRETDTHFDGLGDYLRSINGSVLDHSMRIYKLEERVTKLEDRPGAA